MRQNRARGSQYDKADWEHPIEPSWWLSIENLYLYHLFWGNSFDLASGNTSAHNKKYEGYRYSPRSLSHYRLQFLLKTIMVGKIVAMPTSGVISGRNLVNNIRVA